MPSALIVHSRHLEEYAKQLAKHYTDVEFLTVSGHPTEEVLAIKTDKDIVIGVGGGSVIDTAKIIAKDKQCIAIPTTASGAAMTPYATVWGDEKRSVTTQVPTLRMEPSIAKEFSPQVLQSTIFDALAHAIESFWSKNGTQESTDCAKQSIAKIRQYLEGKKDVNILIEAGNLAGQAIAICKTNVVHAASYPITILYGIDHGTACGIVLPGFVEFMDYEGLPQQFGLETTQELVKFLKANFQTPDVSSFKARAIVKKTIGQDKIQHGPKTIKEQDLFAILKSVDIT